MKDIQLADIEVPDWHVHDLLLFTEDVLGKNEMLNIRVPSVVKNWLVRVAEEQDTTMTQVARALMIRAMMDYTDSVDVKEFNYAREVIAGRSAQDILGISPIRQKRGRTPEEMTTVRAARFNTPDDAKENPSDCEKNYRAMLQAKYGNGFAEYKAVPWDIFMESKEFPCMWPKEFQEYDEMLDQMSSEDRSQWKAEFRANLQRRFDNLTAKFQASRRYWYRNGKPMTWKVFHKDRDWVTRHWRQMFFDE
jgi:hypothetical protein